MLAYSVAVCHKYFSAIDLLHKTSVYDPDSELCGYIVEYPDVMVSDKPRDPYPCIRQFRKLAEKADKSTRDDITILIPIVEYVSKQIDGLRIMLY